VLRSRGRKKNLGNCKQYFELYPGGQFIQYKCFTGRKIPYEKGRYEIKVHLMYVRLNDSYEDFIINTLYIDNKILKIKVRFLLFGIVNRS
jgi:hypothetical protein